MFLPFGTLDPARALRWAFLLLFGLLVALGVRALAAPRVAENPAYDALAKAHTRRMAADSVALDSLAQRLAQAEGHVGADIIRYRTLRDTVNVHDTVQVKVALQRADSVVRSCTALAETCEQFHVRAESSLASLRLDRDRWKLTAESERPSGLDLFVRRTLPVVAFVGGLWAGSRVVR